MTKSEELIHLLRKASSKWLAESLDSNKGFIAFKVLLGVKPETNIFSLMEMPPKSLHLYIYTLPCCHRTSVYVLLCPCCSWGAEAETESGLIKAI